MGNDKFESFLLAEYDHIADAHFETGKQVSKFFNYYLLILAAPVIIVTLIQNKKLDSIINPLQDKDVMYLHWIIFFILVIISLFGLALCWIVVELQHDSIVYARTVNGIRNYFYSEAQLKQEDENKTRVLPKDIKQPGFYSYRHLGIIVGAFSLVNTSFAIAACYIIEMGSLSKWSIVGLVAFCLLHFIIHFALSRNAFSWPSPLQSHK
jgi:hypothetical protein